MRHPRKATIKLLESTRMTIPVKRHDFNENDMRYILKEAKIRLTMIYTYTAIITEIDGTFYAKVPDVPGCITTAASLSEAIILITDALCGCLVVLEDEGITPAAPTPQPQIPHDADAILTLIQADTILYRKRTDNKSVRKNVSLPAWMSALADKRGINCSKVLQDALSAMLA